MEKKIYITLTCLFCICNVLFAQNFGNIRSIESLPGGVSASVGILLQNGKALVTNGKSCELFNPQTEKWEKIADFDSSRSYVNLVALADGRIIAIGGLHNNTSEILSAATYTWTTIEDTFAVKRLFGQSSVMLNNGNVILIGGSLDFSITDDCQLLDVNKMQWRKTAKLNIARYNHTVTKLLDGRILVVGGDTKKGKTSSCEIYDPVEEKWVFTDSTHKWRSRHAAVLLKDGRVLVLGSGTTIEIFDPDTNRWTVKGNVTAGYVKAVTINDEEYVLYTENLGSPGWGIVSLKDFSLKYFSYFDDWIWNQSVTKLNEHTVLMAGGLIRLGESSYGSTNKAFLYDYTLTGIEKNNDIFSYAEDLVISSYPNPFNGMFNLIITSQVNQPARVTLYNTIGQEVYDVYKGMFAKGENKLQIKTQNLPSGIYFISVSTGKRHFHSKILLQK